MRFFRGVHTFGVPWIFNTMQFGLFDDTPRLQPVPVKEDGAESCRIAEEGMVLLKNEGDELPPNARQSSQHRCHRALHVLGGGIENGKWKIETRWL